MANVPSGECGLLRGDDARDLDAAKVDGLPRCTPLCGSRSGFPGRRLIESKDAPLEVFLDRTTESILELPPASTDRKELQTEADLEDGHGRGPDGFRWLTVEPSDDGWI